MDMIKITTSTGEEYSMSLSFFQGIRIKRSAFNERFAVITYIFNNFTVEDEFDTQDVPLGLISSSVLERMNDRVSCSAVSAEAAVYRLKKELEASEQEFLKQCNQCDE